MTVIFCVLISLYILVAKFEFKEGLYSFIVGREASKDVVPLFGPPIINLTKFHLVPDDTIAMDQPLHANVVRCSSLVRAIVATTS